MTRHLSKDELQAGLDHILTAPKDNGRVEALVVRPEHCERREQDHLRVSAAGGIEGDHWSKVECWIKTEDGQPHPGVQICLMSSRCIALIAGERDRWALAGDNILVDMDLGPENLPPGARFAIGSAEFEVSDIPHKGCQKFIERYGRDACVFVNVGPGQTHRLRGFYASVVKDGEIRVGDRLVKLPA